MLTSTKSFIAMGLLSVFFASTVSAATVDLSATRTTVSDVSAASSGSAVDTLGASSVSAAEFATLTIDNNCVSGFKISLTSANNGKMILQSGGSNVSTPASNQQIDYTVQMTASGTLGSGLTAPALTAQALSSSATDYSFTGTATSITSDYNLVMKFNTSAKFIQSGTYKDIITVSIADL